MKFKDGSEIVYNNLDDIFGNTLMGTLYHYVHGKITMTDEKNAIKAVIDVGHTKGKPKDHFEGYIENT